MNHDVIINTTKLTKYYGKQLGIKEVDLSVQRGEVFGYLGPNGAGKTTTIRTLLDFIRRPAARRLFSTLMSGSAVWPSTAVSAI